MSSVDGVLSGADLWHVEHASCIDAMRSMPDNSVDSCITDPPYGLGKIPDATEMLKAWLEGDAFDVSGSGFMNKKWDAFVPGPHYWKELYRVMKPGAHIACFAATRTVDLMGLALRLADFEIRGNIAYCFGSGMPKSKKLAPGVGNGAKPAYEPIIVARKPLDGTLTANYAKWGTGGMNIDDCRVSYASPEDFAEHEAQVKAIQERGGSMEDSWKNSSDLSGASDANPNGRWPADVVMVHSASCVEIGSRQIKANPTWDTPNRETESSFTGNTVSKVRHADTPRDFHFQQGEKIGAETVKQYLCAPGCPVKLLDKQNNEGASRFFSQFEVEDFDFDPFIYVAKPSRAERDMGLAGFAGLSGGKATGRKDGSVGVKNGRAGSGRTGGAKNSHCTVKSLQLMRYLCRLFTPRGGITIDPFSGSGTSGAAALLEGFRFIGCELMDTEKEPYVRIARARIEHVASGEYYRRAAEKKTPAAIVRPGQMSLF